MKVKKISVPNSFLINKYQPADFSDAFECSFNSNKNISADDVMVTFWTDFPRWVDFLFSLRNWLVKPFGLEAGGRDVKAFEDCIRSGESHGLASVPLKSDNETVLCLNDSHLIAYLSVHILSEANKRTVTVSTIVKYHNRLGRLYFFLISPFHNIVVRMMLKHVIKRIA